MKQVNLGLAILVAIALLLFYWQNREPQVSFVLLGQPSREMSLATVLLLAYAVGLGVGLLLLLSWKLQDSLQQRQSRRQAERFLTRLEQLERQGGRIDSDRTSVFLNDADNSPAVRPEVVEEDDWDR